jgi:Sap, sulfolipid-1-addressing protein
MNSVIGDLLPLAVAVAISPIPIIAIILMLLAPEAGRTSVGFLVGWVVGVVGATTVFTVLAATIGLGNSDTGPSKGASWTKIALGALLLLLAVRQWRSRPSPGQEAELPTWMAALSTFTFIKAAGLGVALSAANLKNLLLCAAAGTIIGGSGISTSDQVVAVAVFCVIAVASVAAPVIAYAVARDQMRGPLDRLFLWLQANNATVMAVILLVIGVVLIGKGIGGL